MQQEVVRKRFKVGVVGAGYVSSYHIRALRKLDNVEVVGIADPDIEKCGKLAKVTGIPAVCGSLDDLLKLQPDVIHILTPPHLHADLAIKAMRAGCDVLVEKPLAESVEDCDRILAVARETGRKAGVNHSARMDPVVLEALELVRSGACGDLLAVHFLRNSDYTPYAGGPLPPPYRRAAYPFEDIGIHGIYMIEAFLGPISNLDLHYRSSGLQPNLHFDEWHGIAQCEKGTAHLFLSWNARPMQNELLIHGTRGIIRVDCYLQTLTIERTLPLPKPLQRMFYATVNALRTAVRVPVNAFRFITGSLLPNPGIQVSVARFYEALGSGRELPIPAEEGRRAVVWATTQSEEADRVRNLALQTRPSRNTPRILVTGATGFLGGALLRRLRKQGLTVRILARRRPANLANDPNVEIVCGDLGDPEVVDRAMQGIDLVYHVGATMKGGKLDHDRGTVWGTRNIVDACLRHGVKRLVYVSSVIHLHHAAHQTGNPVDESYPLEPRAQERGYYTQAKLEAEEIVRAAIADRNLPAVILRPGQIFGPGGEKSAPAGAIGLAGRWIVVGSGNLLLPLVYVEDVVDAILLAAEKDNVCGSLFHLVDSEPVTQREFVDFCQRKYGSAIKAAYVPKWILYTAAFAADVVGRITKRSLPLSTYRLRSSQPIHPFNCENARKNLGWTPKVGAKRGLEETFGNATRPEQQAQPVENLVGTR